MHLRRVLLPALLLGGFLWPPASCRAEAGPGPLERVLTSLQTNGAAWTRQGTTWLLEREAVGHLVFMATDPRGGTGGGGWYRPSQSRYDWNWLRRRLDRDDDEAISLDEFPGPREWFEALDKDRDGSLTSEDFQWFGDSALARASMQVKMLFGQIDRDSNGQVTPAEWRRWFDQISGGKDFLGQDDLLPLFLGSARGRGGNRPQRRTFADRLPVLCSYISGDVGSLSEGPAVNGPAPYFTLATSDGAGTLDLSRHRGQKPLILIFGSFT